MILKPVALTKFYRTFYCEGTSKCYSEWYNELPKAITELGIPKADLPLIECSVISWNVIAMLYNV